MISFSHVHNLSVYRPQYYNDDKSIPVYSWGSVEYTIGDIAELLIIQNFSEDKVAKAQPIGVCHNASFLIDLSQLGNKDDIKADDLGVWASMGTPSRLVVVNEKNCSLSVEVLPRGRKLGEVPEKLRRNVFRISRGYYRHPQPCDFHRVINVVKG